MSLDTLVRDITEVPYRGKSEIKRWIEQWHRERLEEKAEIIESVPIMFPKVDEYIKVVKEGNVDDMYALGFRKGLTEAAKLTRDSRS